MKAFLQTLQSTRTETSTSDAVLCHTQDICFLFTHTHTHTYIYIYKERERERKRERERERLHVILDNVLDGDVVVASSNSSRAITFILDYYHWERYEHLYLLSYKYHFIPSRVGL